MRMRGVCVVFLRGVCVVFAGLALALSLCYNTRISKN